MWSFQLVYPGHVRIIGEHRGEGKRTSGKQMLHNSPFSSLTDTFYQMPMQLYTYYYTAKCPKLDETFLPPQDGFSMSKFIEICNAVYSSGQSKLETK